MKKFLYSNRLFIGILTSVILIFIGGLYYLKHLENEKLLEEEHNMRLDYKQWHLPEGAKARIGSGTIRALQYSPDGSLLAAVSDIGVWIFNVQTAEPQNLLAAHTGIINCISFSPDVSTLAVGTEFGKVQLWDISTGEHQKTFTNNRFYSVGVDNVCFISEGHTLAVVYNSWVDLWDIATGQRKNTLTANKNDATEENNSDIPPKYMALEGQTTSFSPEGKTVASYNSDGSCHFWDVASKKEIRTFSVESSGKPVAISSDMQTLAIVNERYKGSWSSRVWEVNLWDVKTQTKRKVSETDYFGIPFLVFSPDGSLLASSIEGNIRIWDVITGKENKRINGYVSSISAVAFSPDNRTLVSSSWDNTLRFWDVDTGKEKKKIYGYGGFFRDVWLSADSQTLIKLAYASRNIHLWNMNTIQHEKNFIGHKKGVTDVVLSPDGSKLACNTPMNNTIHLWDVNTGQLNKLKGPRHHLTDIAFDRDGEVLVNWGSASKRKGLIQHWDIETGSIQRALQLNDPDELSVLEDLYFDKRIFAGIEKFFSPKLFVWNLDTGDYNFTDLEAKEIEIARFSSDGRMLAIVYGGLTKMDKNIALRDVETGDSIRILTGHTDEVKCIAFSPDGQTLASGGAISDRTIRLWDIETGSSRVITDPYWKDNWDEYWHNINSKVALALAFSPDSQTLASGMKLGDIYLWETATGAKKKLLRGHSEGISHLFFSPDGQTLISAGYDGIILIWDLTE